MAKPCAECGRVLDPIEFTIFRRSKDGMTPYYSKWCRTCSKDNAEVLKHLKQKHGPAPPSGTPCQCCGRIDRLFADHDRRTKTLKGWVCRNCNAGIGMQGDSLEGVEKVVAYLQRWKASTKLTTDSGP